MKADEQRLEAELRGLLARAEDQDRVEDARLGAAVPETDLPGEPLAAGGPAGSDPRGEGGAGGRCPRDADGAAARAGRAGQDTGGLVGRSGGAGTWGRAARGSGPRAGGRRRRRRPQRVRARGERQVGPRSAAWTRTSRPSASMGRRPPNRQSRPDPGRRPSSGYATRSAALRVGPSTEGGSAPRNPFPARSSRRWGSGGSRCADWRRREVSGDWFACTPICCGSMRRGSQGGGLSRADGARPNPGSRAGIGTAASRPAQAPPRSGRAGRGRAGARTPHRLSSPDWAASRAAIRPCGASAAARHRAPSGVAHARSVLRTGLRPPAGRPDAV
jgi:hypothetical protein